MLHYCIAALLHCFIAALLHCFIASQLHAYTACSSSFSCCCCCCFHCLAYDVVASSLCCPVFPGCSVPAQGATVTDLSDAVLAAYDAPFPDESYKAGARIFPTLVPAHPTDPASGANRAAWLALSRFDKPLLTAFSDSDPSEHAELWLSFSPPCLFTHWPWDPSSQDNPQAHSFTSV